MEALSARRDGELFQWHRAKGNYLFPVRALSRCFRGKMVSALRNASQSRDQTQSVVCYLARYTYKAAISNSRITNVDDNGVQFHWKDYRDDQQKTMALSGEEFIRRYLLHILPKGFMRIRHLGFLANRCRSAKLDCIRRTLQDKDEIPLAIESSTKINVDSLTREKKCQCPKCRRGCLVVLYEIGASFRRKAGYTLQ